MAGNIWDEFVNDDKDDKEDMFDCYKQSCPLHPVPAYSRGVPQCDGEEPTVGCHRKDGCQVERSKPGTDVTPGVRPRLSGQPAKFISVSGQLQKIVDERQKGSKWEDIREEDYIAKLKPLLHEVILRRMN